MKKKKGKGWLLTLLVAGTVIFGAKRTMADVIEAKPGQTYTGEYAVIVNTSEQDTESSGTLQFQTGADTGQSQMAGGTTESQQSMQKDCIALPAAQTVTDTQTVASQTGSSYKVGDIRKGYGYPNGTPVWQSYVCIGVGEHCYVWMEMNLMQTYQKKGLLSTIARETAQVYDGEPYAVLNTLCGGSFPALDGSGRMSILLEILNTSTGVYMYESDITAIHLKAPEISSYVAGQMASYNALLVHEGQHALLHLMTGFPGEAKWFTEGLSVAAMDYVWGSTDNNAWLSYMKDNEALRNGASLLYSSYRNSTGLDYSIQYLFVRYMIDQMAQGYDPMAVLPGLYQQNASGKTAQQFLTSFTGREFATFLADFYTAIAACEKTGNYGFYMDAVAENGADMYPRYTGTTGQAVQIEKAGAILVPLYGGSFTMSADCGPDIVVRIVGDFSSDTVLNGAGTEESPYLVHSAQELRYIYKEPSAVYRLENDIRMLGAENFTVPSFSGTLDGNGHTIYGLRRPLVASNTKGTIKNLSVEAAFTGDCIGMQGVIANENYGTITNCHVSGSIKGRLLRGRFSTQYPMLGGIVGRNYQGFVISDCTVSAEMDVVPSVVNCWVGGIAGETNGILQNCRFTGKIHVTQGNGSAYTVYVGGMTGEVLKDYGFSGSVKSSSSLGAIIVTGGTKSVGQICGYSNLFSTAEEAAVYLQNCTWNTDKGTLYGTPVSVDDENQVEEDVEISLPAPEITETRLQAVQGKETYINTGNVTGGSGEYETTIISEQLPTGLKRTAMPGEYWDCFMYQGTPTGSVGVYTSKYQVKDKVSEKGLLVTVTIEVVTEDTAKIYSFIFDKEANGLSKTVQATIEGAKIEAIVPADTSLQALRPGIEYGYLGGSRLTYFDGTGWKEYYTNLSFDFSEPRLFKVTAADQKTTQIYTVTVTKEAGNEKGDNVGGGDNNANGGNTGNGGEVGEPEHHHQSVVDPGTEATCTKEGKTAGSHCVTCGEILTEQKSIQKKAHVVVADPAVAATCTRTGKTEGSHCRSCGKILTPQYTVGKRNHTVIWEAGVEPTFWSEGRTARAYCSVCHTTLQSAQTIARRTGTGNLNMTSFPMRVKQKTTALRVENMAAGDWVTAWKSSNPKVATVSGKGLITAKKQGTAWIQVTLASGKVFKAQVKVQKKQVKTTRLTANTCTLRLKAGKGMKLNPTAYPLTTQQKITYSSKNKKIATVNSKGWIQAKKPGWTNITIKSGGKKVNVKVGVFK